MNRAANQFWHRPRFASSAAPAPRYLAVSAPLEQVEGSHALRDIAAAIGVSLFVLSVAGSIVVAAFLCLFCSF